MATLDDLKSVLESIDRSMTDQKTLLSDVVTAQNALLASQQSVNTSIVNQPSTSLGESVGSAVSGIGTGVGSAAAGLGLGGLAALAGMAIFANFDAQAIKDNVITLLSISDEVGGKVEFFKEGGSFGLAMTGLGIGLGVFAVGQFAAGLAQFVTTDGWPEEVKKNVLTLFSIGDELNQGLLDTLAAGGTFGAVMFGLGFGLKRLAIGAGAAGIAELIADWGSGGNWAQEVKDNVGTLLSIATLAQDDVVQTFARTGAFASIMFGLGFGLLEFSVGAGVAGITELIADWASGGNWAQEVKDNVGILLSISQLEGVGASTVGFAATMTGIGAGLLAFSVGAGVTGLTELITDWASGGNWAQEVKDNVTTLLSIVGLAPEGSVDEFTNVMTKLGDGLSSFASGNFLGALKNVGTAILGFFSGQESPFEQIRLIAADANNLEKAADAIEKIANSLEKFGSIDIDVGNIDFKGLAENLGNTLPLLNALANGGKVGEGIFDGPEIDFGKGILDSSLKLDEMAAAISKVNYVLGQTTEFPASLRESATVASAEAAISTNTSNQIALLTTHTEKMIELSQTILKSLEIIESTVAPASQQAPTSVVSNSGNTDARQSSTNINITNNQTQRNYSELNHTSRLGF